MAKKGPATAQDRLHRIEGQIRGIENMLERKESVSKILIQLQAVISSMESLKLELVKSQIKEKLLEELDNVVDLLK